MQNVDLIAVDGGPCGGKTTGIVRLSEALITAGMFPMVIPEAATTLIQGGVRPWQLSNEAFQRAFLRMQYTNEEIWKTAAAQLTKNSKERVVILSDRGLPSSIAYIDDPHPFSRFEEHVAPLGFSSAESVFSRYLGVLHFVTAADGAEEYYTLDNNSARTETAEMARALCLRTKSAWLAHPHLHEIPNISALGEQVSFERKMSKAIAALFHLLGIPEPVEIEDKYLLQAFDADALPVPCEKVFIMQTYLNSFSDAISERVRKRVWRDGVSYIHTLKEPFALGGRVERERFITRHEYAEMLERADPSKRTIHKIRHCFLWGAQYFEVDVFQNLPKALILLEREKTSLNETTVLPPFIEAVRDVTGESEFSNSNLARI